MYRSKVCLIFQMLFALLLPAVGNSTAFAQNDRGAIKGRITDSTGAVLPGAVVTVRNTETGITQTASSNDAGDYNFQSLIPGTYSLSVEMQGFKKLQRSNLNADVNGTNEQDVSMELGSATETVNVQEDIQQLSTSSASIGLIVEQRSMRELPLIYGNPFTLETLAPGVSPSGVNPNIHTYDSTTASVSVNGSMLNALEYRLDGAPNNRIRLSAYTPSTEFVGQYRMETATYDSSQGHASGGFVNTSIKSGTNAFHGGAFAYYQNPTLNANTWSLSPNPINAKPTWLRFGGTLGGPIVKNKAFFFVGYERSRQAAPNPQTLTVPTLAERKGDFSALYSQDPAHPAGPTNQYQLYEPTSGRLGSGSIVSRTPIPGNIITNISPIAQKILSFYPEPNAPGNSDGTGNFVYAGSEPDYYYSVASRVDYTMTPRQSLFGHFVLSNRLQSKTNAYFYPVSGTTLTYANKGVALGYNFTVNPTTVVEAHLTWTRFVNSNIVNSQGLLDATAIGMPNYLVDGMPDAANSFPNIAPTGFQALADKSNIASHDDITMGALQVSKLVSTHFLRTGIEYRMYNTNGGSGAGNNGAYAMTGNYMTANSNTAVPSRAGFGLAQMERGILSTAKLTINSDYALRSNYVAGFLMDDWKANPRLTINAGIRYEYEGPNSERHNKANTYFDFDAVNPIAAAAKTNYASIAPSNPALLPASQFSVNGGLRFAGGDNGNNLYTSQKLLFLPRIGFSYQPEQNTVVRGGFGLFADSVQLFILSGGNSGSTNNATLTPQQGYSATTNLNGSGDNGLSFSSTLDNPFPTGFTQPTGSSLGLETFLGQSITFQPKNPQIPYNMRWSFGIQHQFGSWLAALDYVGNHGVHVPVQRNYNAVPRQYLSTVSSGYDRTTFDRLNGNVTNPFNGIIPSTATLGSSRTSVAQLLRPYPEFTDVTAYLNNGMSIYHGLQAQLNRRFQSGLSLTTSFTWSRTMDASQYLNTSDTSLWYGISQLDRTFRFATSFLYEIPFGRGRQFFHDNPITSAIIGGWQVQGVYQVQSGQPLNFNPGNTSPIYTGEDPVDSAWGRSAYKNSIPGPGKAGFWFDRTNWLQTTSGCNSGVCTNVLPNQYQIRTFPIRFSGLRSDFLNQFDLGVQRNLPLWRESQMQLRVEAINALNHPVYSAPNTDWTSSSFAQITTQANQPRVYQFGAFVRF